ncbi:MAG: BrnT family toxin [Proteobacteria bacterium]|nr:BrnT family toxin [Pseudomonadota bacterium]
MELEFEWDEDKAATNLAKHGVTFHTASRVFFDLERTDRHDGREDYGEDRFVTVGLVGTTELIVAYTMRTDIIRIISARKAEPHEQREYWKNR